MKSEYTIIKGFKIPKRKTNEAPAPKLPLKEMKSGDAIMLQEGINPYRYSNPRVKWMKIVEKQCIEDDIDFLTFDNVCRDGKLYLIKR